MDTTTFPALVVPELQIDTHEMLMDPANIRLGEDIRDTDLIIDNLIRHLKEKGADASWLFRINEFSHEDKVKWILSLPDPGKQLLSNDSFIFPVSVHVTMMLKVAETVSGESLYEKKQAEMKLEKCLPV